MDPLNQLAFEGPILIKAPFDSGYGDAYHPRLAHLRGELRKILADLHAQGGIYPNNWWCQKGFLNGFIIAAARSAKDPDERPTEIKTCVYIETNERPSRKSTERIVARLMEIEIPKSPGPSEDLKLSFKMPPLSKFREDEHTPAVGVKHSSHETVVEDPSRGYPSETPAYASHDDDSEWRSRESDDGNELVELEIQQLEDEKELNKRERILLSDSLAVAETYIVVLFVVLAIRFIVDVWHEQYRIDLFSFVVSLVSIILGVMAFYSILSRSRSYSTKGSNDAGRRNVSLRFRSRRDQNPRRRRRE